MSGRVAFDRPSGPIELIGDGERPRFLTPETLATKGPPTGAISA